MSCPSPPILHAGLIALRLRGRWAGVLVEGPSGSGKSDLALRAMARGWRLVADDRVIAWTSGGRLFGRAPPALAGLVEARGLGVRTVAFLPLCEVVAAVRCVPARAELDRCPEPATRALAGHFLPLVRVRAGEASALDKLVLALAEPPV